MWMQIWVIYEVINEKFKFAVGKRIETIERERKKLHRQM